MLGPCICSDGKTCCRFKQGFQLAQDRRCVGLGQLPVQAVERSLTLCALAMQHLQQLWAVAEITNRAAEAVIGPKGIQQPIGQGRPLAQTLRFLGQPLA